MNQTLSASQNVRNYIFTEELVIERAPIIWIVTDLIYHCPYKSISRDTSEIATT